METFKARVISRGRITIPDTLRELLGIEEGDFVEVQLKKVDNPKEASKE